MIGLNSGSILAVFFALWVFGIFYNFLVAWAESRGYLEGFTWLAAAIGVLVTLAGIAIISWQCALLALAAFCFSGFPMAAGAIWRYIKLREKAHEYVASTARMAE